MRQCHRLNYCILRYESLSDAMYMDSTGPLAEVHLPIDKTTRTSKGFALATFVMPENAVQALTQLDGTIFQVGRDKHWLRYSYNINTLYIIVSRVKPTNGICMEFVFRRQTISNRVAFFTSYRQRRNRMCSHGSHRSSHLQLP